METFSINDNKRYRTHKEICSHIGVIPATRKCWYRIDDKSYIWAPKMTIESANWNLLPEATQDGKIVQWINFLSEDGDKLFAGTVKNNAEERNSKEPYSNYQQVVFGKYPVKGGHYYKFLGVFRYNEVREYKKGVRFTVYNRITTKF